MMIDPYEGHPSTNHNTLHGQVVNKVMLIGVASEFFIKKGALVRLGMGGGHSLRFDTWWDCLLPTIEKKRFSSKV